MQALFKFLYVYIVKCSDNSYYVGVTNNVDKRVNEHNFGLNTSSYTYSRRPVELVYCEHFQDYNLAISWEKTIKKWSRKKKEALINDNWQKLKELSQCKNLTHHKLKDLRDLLSNEEQNNEVGDE